MRESMGYYSNFDDIDGTEVPEKTEEELIEEYKRYLEEKVTPKEIEETKRAFERDIERKETDTEKDKTRR